MKVPIHNLRLRLVGALVASMLGLPVVLQAQSVCPTVSGLQATPATTGVQLNWSLSGSETPTGVTVTVINTATQTTVPVTTTPYNAASGSCYVTGLQASTSYMAVVQADCAGGAHGTADTVQFNTTCPSLPKAEIGDGTTLVSQLPGYQYYNYSYSQQLYFANEMGTAGTITGVAFQYNETLATLFANCTIYMGHTSQASLASGWVPVDSMQVVYVGSMNNDAAGWNTFRFTHPFHYNGHSNVVIAVDRNDGAYAQGPSFYCHSTGSTITARYTYQDNADILPTAPESGQNNNTNTQRNNIRFLGDCDFSVCMYPAFGMNDITDSTMQVAIAAGNTETAWRLRYRKAGTNTWTVTDPFTTQPYTLTGLVGSTLYEVAAGAVCTDTVMWSGASEVLTTCVPLSRANLPMQEGFESYASQSKSVHPCWTLMQIQQGAPVETRAYPYVYGTASYANSGSRSLYMYAYEYNQTETYTVLPPAENVSELQLSFSLRAQNIAAIYPWFEVGVMSDPNDYTTFEAVQACRPTAANTYEDFSVSFTDYTGTGTHIALRATFDHTATTSNSNGFYIDDLLLIRTPTCLKRPTAISIDSVAPTQLYVSWEDTLNANRYIVEYDTVDFYPGLAAHPYVLSNSKNAVLSNLSNATSYYVYVRSICGNGDTSLFRGDVFTTECLPLSNADLPYVYGFDDPNLTCLYNSFNPLYTTLYISEASSNYTTAPASLYYYLRNNNAPASNMAYIMMPRYDDDISQLAVTLDAKSSQLNAAYIEVGVMTNPVNEATFVPVDTLDLGIYFRNYLVDLSSYQGNGHYVALRFRQRTNYAYAYFDNLHMQPMPSCDSRVDSIRFSHQTTESVTINWVETGDAEAWTVQYDTTQATLGTENCASIDVDAASMPAVLDGLMPGEDYFIAIYSNCGGELSIPMYAHFRTECEPIANDELPLHEGFDTYGNGTNKPINPCWKQYSNIDNFDDLTYPYPNTGQKLDGTASMFLYNYPAGNPSRRSFVVLPRFEADINQLYVSFGSYASNNSGIEMGVMTDPYDPETFQPMYRMIHRTADGNANQWVSHRYSLAGYADTGRYIAFRPTGGTSSASAYLDSVVVDLLPSCAWPTSIALLSRADTRAELTWVGSSNASGYQVCYNTTNFDPNSSSVTTQNTTDTTIELTGLSSATEYYVYVRTRCGSNSYSDWEYFHFRTLCAPTPIDEDTSFFEGFEAYANLTDVSCTEFTGGNGNLLTYSYASGTKCYYNSFTNNSSFMVLLPQMDTVLQELQLKFKARVSYPASTHFIVGVADECDLNSFDTVTVLSCSVANAYEQLSAVFSRYTGTHKRIAIIGVTNGNYEYAYLDDIEIGLKPGCVAPGNVVYNYLHYDTVAFSWTPRGEESRWRVEYAPLGTSTLTTVTVDEPRMELGNLQANTDYRVYLRALCTGNEVSDSLYFTFRTLCTPLAVADLPWRETFDSYTPNSSTNMRCLGRYCLSSGAVLTNSYPYPYGRYSSSSDQSLYFYAYTSGGTQFNNWITLPLVAADLSTLTVSFDYMCATAATSAEFQVGVMSAPADPTTFQTIASVSAVGDTAWHTANLSLASYEGDLDMLVIRFYEPGTAYSYGYLDNVELLPASTCARPSNIVVSNVGTTTATVDWTENGTATSWTLAYTGNDGVEHTATATSKPYTLTGLNPNNHYILSVVANCSGNASSYRTYSEFFTECVVLTRADLPYRETFDSLSSNQYARFNNCWTKYMYPGYDETSYPYPNATASSAPYGLYFYAFNNTTSQQLTTSVAILPEITGVSLDSLAFSFDAYFTQVNRNTFVIGTITDAYDFSTFVPLDTVRSGLANTWQTLDFSLQGGQPNSRIAVAMAYASSEYAYMDNAEVYILQACPQVIRRTTANDVAGTTAALSWQVGPSLETPSLQLEVVNLLSGNVEQTIPLTTETDIVLNDLLGSTRYRVRVGVRCENSVTMLDSTEFTTLCEGLEYVQVGDLTGASTNVYIPLYDFYKGSASQSIFTAEELGGEPLSMSSLAYHISSQILPTTLDSVSIYLAHTSEVNRTTFLSPDSMQLVYQGAPLFRQGWFWIGFDSTFDYNGSDNLMVLIVDAVGPNYGQNSVNFTTNTSTTTNTLYYYSDSQPFTAATSAFTLNQRPVIRLGSCVIIVCEAPIVNLTEVGTNSASFAISAVSDETAWAVEYRQGESGDWTVADSAFDASYTLSNLNNGTTYSIRFGTLCRDGMHWSDTLVFTTICRPTNVAVSNITTHSADVQWQNTCSVNSWNVVYESETGVSNTVLASTTSASLTNLVFGTQYSVYVQALDADGNVVGIASDTVTFTTLDCGQATNIQTSVDGTAVTLTWEGGANNESWRVEYGLAGFSHGEETVVTSETTSATISGLQAETAYDFYVLGVCESNTLSLYPEKVTATTGAASAGIDQASAGASAKLFPNPASGSTTLTLEGIEGQVTVDLLDMGGRVVRSTTFDCSGDCLHRLTISDLSQGAYFVRISGEGVNIVRKLIVK